MEKRVKKNSDYWFDIIFGGFLTFIIIYFGGNLILTKLNLDFLNNYYLFFCLITVVFYQWKDDNYEIIETKLSRNENFELIKRTLEKLNWEYEINSIEVKLTYNKYILKFLNVSIIPKNEKIHFNFQYHSTTKTGRLPFYFGISTFLKRRFLKSLKNELNRKPNG
jgi:hypothetical protein